MQKTSAILTLPRPAEPMRVGRAGTGSGGKEPSRWREKIRRAANRPSPALRYAFAAVSIAGAIFVRMLLNPVLGDGFPFALPFLAILLTAWFGGFGPALAAVVLGSFATDYFLIPPHLTFKIDGMDQWAGLVLYECTGLGIALLGGSMHAARRRAEDRSAAARRKAVLINQTYDAILVWDLAGTISFWNRGAEWLYGIPKREAIGRVNNELLQTHCADGVESILDALESNGSWEGELQHTTRDGRTIIVESRMLLVREDPPYVVETNRDVTKRRTAESELLEAHEQLEARVLARTAELQLAHEAIRTSEARLRIITETARVGLIILDSDHRYRYVNRAYANLLRMETSMMIGRRIVDVLPYAYESQIRPRLERAFRNERMTWEMHLPPLAPGHSERYFMVSYEPGVDRGERIVVAVITDITERKLAGELGARLSAIVRSSSDAIIGKSLEGIITSWNRGAETIFGFTEEEAVGQSVVMLMPPEMVSEEVDILAKIVRGETVQFFETQRMRKDGQLIDVSVTISPIHDNDGRIVGASKIARDITLRKRAQAALRESEELFSAAFRSSPAAIAINRRHDMSYVEVNEAFLRLHGCAREEIVGRSPLEMHFLEARSILALREKLETEGSVSNEEVEIHSRSGQKVHVAISLTMIQLHGERCALSMLIDITERKHAEAALQIRQAHAESLLRLSRTLEHAITIQDVLRAARTEIHRMFGFQAAWLFMLSDDGQYLERVIVDEGGTSDHPLAESERFLIKGDLMLEEIASTDDIVIVEDARTDPRTNKAIVEKLRNRTIVNVPIQLAGEHRGVIGTGTFGEQGIRTLTAAERELLSAMASHMATVLDRVMAAHKRRLAETALRESEASLAAAQTRAKIGNWDVDAATDTVRWSAEMFRIFGRDPALGELSFQEIAQIVHPDDRETFIKSNIESMERGTPHALDFRIIRRDGSVHWIEGRGDPILGAEGRTVRMSGTAQDVTARKLAEAALQQERERFEATAAISPGVLCSLRLDPDCTWRLAYAAPGIEKIFGLRPEEMMNDASRAIERVAPADRDSFRSALADSAGTMAPLHHKWRVLHPTKGELWVEGYSTPVAEPDGGVVWHGVIIDVTELYRAESELRESEVFNREVIDSLPAHIAVLDRHGKIVIVNEAWRRFANANECGTDNHYLGANYLEICDEAAHLHDDEIAGKVAAGIREVMDGSRASFMLEYPCHSPTERRWFQLRVCPLTASSKSVVAAHEDITERRLAEERVSQLNTELEHRVVQRTAQLEAANKELEAFSYSVSHDLRSPLRAVDGFSQALLEDYGPHLPEEALDYLQSIRQGAQRMGHLIDDLLTFSRLSRSPIGRRKICTEDLVNSTLEELAPQRAGRKIEFKKGSLPTCWGDPALLKQVWINLLSNALKYTQRREEAVVEIGARTENGETVFFVRDNGTGFDMRYVGKLFGVFQRLHRAEDYEGTGVGLAIVQRVIHRHGGRVWAEGAVEQGATFYFTLPTEGQL